MSGIVIPLFSRRNFTNGASITSESILLKAVDVSKYTQGVLIVRAHTWTATGTPTVDVIARNTAPSMEDPSKDFVITTSAVATATVSGVTAPALVVATLTANFASMLQISVKLTTGATATINTDLSAELVLRE